MGGIKRKTRLTITMNNIFKSILIETLEKHNNNISNYIRDIIKDYIRKGKKLNVNSTSKKIKIEEYPKNTEIQVKMDVELKNEFKKLLCKGTTMSFVLQYRMIEDLLNKTNRKKYRKEIDCIENKVMKYITITETEDKIIYTIDIKEKRIDIYLEEELKEMYVEMMKKLNKDVSSSLRYFVRVYSKEGNKITTKKVVKGNRNTQFTLTLNQHEYNQFKSLFTKSSSMSSFFREKIIQELYKNGYPVYKYL